MSPFFLAPPSDFERVIHSVPGFFGFGSLDRLPKAFYKRTIDLFLLFPPFSTSPAFPQDLEIVMLVFFPSTTLPWWRAARTHFRFLDAQNAAPALFSLPHYSIGY